MTVKNLSTHTHRQMSPGVAKSPPSPLENYWFRGTTGDTAGEETRNQTHLQGHYHEPTGARGFSLEPAERGCFLENPTLQSQILRPG